MDPSMILGAAGAGVSLLARLFGEAIAAGDYDRAERLKQQAVAEYGDETLPEFERIEAQEVGRTELAGIQTDAAPRNAQMEALSRLAEFAAPGMSAEDEGDLRVAQDAAGGVAARAAGQGEQLAAARGLQRSGLSQALAAQGAQAGAQTAADTATSLASQRRQRQLQAISQMGSMGGQIRQQDYGQASDAARAQDTLNQFNANMRAGAIDSRNRQQQQRFGNQMTLANNRNTARTGLGDFYEGRANRNSQTAQDVGASIQGGMQGGANYLRKKGQ